MAGPGIVLTAALTEFGQHRARFDGGKLVLIAEEDEAGRRRQGAEQGGHHLLMNHRGFVHHEYVEFEGIGGVMAKATTVGAGAEQAVQGARRTQAGEGGSHVGYPSQLRKGADRALPPSARLILLGDQDQLASVEAGAVLAELCLGSGKYDAGTCHYIRASCGAAPQPGDNGSSPLASNIIRLQHSHRFNTEIGALADAVHGGHPESAIGILQAAHTGTLAWQPAPASHQILELARTESAYGRVWQTAGQPPPKDRQQHSAWVNTILNDYADFRILCALRQGPWGVTGINRAIEDYLQRQGILQSRGLWYAGRPTLVTRNDPTLGLSNGDIGIALPDPDKRLRVYFPNSEDAPRAILPSRLNHAESAWAMTVHKAQGSEFAHTVLILPPEDSPVLSRELLYTAITRARKCFTLIAPRERLENAIQRQTRRMSGLHAALYDPRR